MDLAAHHEVRVCSAGPVRRSATSRLNADANPEGGVTRAPRRDAACFERSAGVAGWHLVDRARTRSRWDGYRLPRARRGARSSRGDEGAPPRARRRPGAARALPARGAHRRPALASAHRPDLCRRGAGRSGVLRDGAGGRRERRRSASVAKARSAARTPNASSARWHGRSPTPTRWGSSIATSPSRTFSSNGRPAAPCSPTSASPPRSIATARSRCSGRPRTSRRR